MGDDDDDDVKIAKHNNPLRFLPEELIVKILLRLQVKSLLQFKCVCKSWKTIISDSQFVNNHLQTSNTYASIIAATYGFREFISYPIKPLLENPSTLVEPVRFSMGYNYPRIIGSCNGLLCLFDFDNFCVRLWNPSIDLKSKRSPTLVSPRENIVRYHGFGYDKLNDKYKVIVGVSYYTKAVTKMYTFGESLWKTLQNFPVSTDTYLGKLVNNILNWIVCKDGVDSKEQVILSFDLEKETHGEVLLPQHDGYRVCNHGLFVLSNCLCVCFDNSNESQWAVWLMKEYGVFESWTNLAIIPRGKLLCNNMWQLQRFVEPLFVSENGFFLLVNIESSQLILYNINNAAVDYHKTFGKVASNLHIYHESLVSPKS